MQWRSKGKRRKKSGSKFKQRENRSESPKEENECDVFMRDGEEEKERGMERRRESVLKPVKKKKRFKTAKISPHPPRETSRSSAKSLTHVPLFLRGFMFPPWSPETCRGVCVSWVRRPDVAAGYKRRELKSSETRSDAFPALHVEKHENSLRMSVFVWLEINWSIGDVATTTWTDLN